MKIKDLTEGEAVVGLICTVKSFRAKGNDFEITLSDAEQEVFAVCSRNLYDAQELSSFKNKTLVVDGLMKPGLPKVRRPCLKIRCIRLEKEDKSVLPHIEDNRLNLYLARIKEYASTIQNPFYRALVNAYFCQENIEVMRKMPATHVRQGTPSGGMLHATCCVLELAAQSAFYYLRNANCLYCFNEKSQIDWDLLFAGAILHLAGNMVYFSKEDTATFRKDVISVEAGFSECRTEYINELIIKNSIPVDRASYCSLLGVMSSLNEQKTGVRECRQEAVILYHSYNTFLTLDAFDQEAFQLAKNELIQEEEMSEAAFSDRLGCYISDQEIRRKKQIITNREGGGNHAV